MPQRNARGLASSVVSVNRLSSAVQVQLYTPEKDKHTSGPIAFTDQLQVDIWSNRIQRLILKKAEVDKMLTRMFPCYPR